MTGMMGRMYAGSLELPMEKNTKVTVAKDHNSLDALNEPGLTGNHVKAGLKMAVMLANNHGMTPRSR